MKSGLSPRRSLKVLLMHLDATHFYALQGVLAPSGQHRRKKLPVHTRTHNTPTLPTNRSHKHTIDQETLSDDDEFAFTSD